MFYTDTRVKQNLYRPGETLRFPGGWGSQISRKRHMKVVSLSALRTSRLYSQETKLVLIFVRGWVDPRVTVQPEGLCQWKIPITPSGIWTLGWFLNFMQRSPLKLLKTPLTQPLKSLLLNSWVYVCVYMCMYFIVFIKHAPSPWGDTTYCYITSN